MSQADRPTVVGIRPPEHRTDGSATVPTPDQSLVRVLLREAIDEAKASIAAEVGAPKAPSGQGPPQRFPGALVLVLALGGAFLLQRGEATRDMVAQSQTQQAEILAKLDARIKAAEDAQAAASARATKGEDALREALWILAEDSRANWDALGLIHDATKPPASPSLRAPATSARLANLREQITAKP